jgi:hypothetical protein
VLNGSNSITETEMSKITKAKLVWLGSAKRLTKGGDQGAGEFLVARNLIG